MTLGTQSPRKPRSRRVPVVQPRRHPARSAVFPLSQQSEQAPSRSRVRGTPHLVRWLSGFVIASALVVGLSPYFISTLRVYQWSDPIGDYVLKEGYVHRNREEGWARTQYGAWGVAGPAAVGRRQQSTILIWGDSYIEAHQVNDDQKVAAQFNRMPWPSEATPVTAVSVGHSYWSVADYYYHIPGYDKLLHPACHFIVLAEHGLKDLGPDEESFRSRPEYAFVPRTLVDPGRNRIVERLNQWHLADLSLAPWKAVRTLAQDVRNLRFAVGPCRRATPTGGDASLRAGEPNDVVAGWAFALDRLKSATNEPIVLVVVPEVPYLQQGIVRLENPQADGTARLAELCRARHVGLIDMTEVLVSDYLSTGVLSRGFNNGRPGCGHLNARGHALLAQQIRAYLESHPTCR